MKLRTQTAAPSQELPTMTSQHRQVEVNEGPRPKTSPSTLACVSVGYNMRYIDRKTVYVHGYIYIYAYM